MAIRKNKKRIDPRYFLNETTYRDLEEQEGMQITGATDSDVAAKEQIVDWFVENGDVYGDALDAILETGPEGDKTGFYKDLSEFFADKDLPAILNSMLRQGLLNKWDGRAHRQLDTVRKMD